MNYNFVIRNVTEDFIKYLSAGNIIPAPKDMADQLLKKIQENVELENSVAQSGRKIKTPQRLENISIAELILAFYSVKRITWTNSDKESNNLLCIYQTDGENSGLYVPHKNAFANLIRQFQYCISDKDVKEIMSILSDMAPLCSVTRDKDLIAVNNGIFDYKNKKLLDFAPKYVFTAKSKVNYNPQAYNVVIHNQVDGSDWDVETWFNSLSDNPEIRELLWQVTGAVIRPHVPWNKVVCLYSEIGNNGKGTLCELLRQLCGNHVALSFEQFNKDFLLEQLIGASAIIGDENNTYTELKSSEILKCVITGDSFTLNGKYKMPVTFRFRGLMVECVNSLPKFSDKSESLTRRLLMIPFEKCFTGRERTYIKSDYLKRQDVLEYVLHKVLNTSYYSFQEPKACRELLEEYKQFNDPVSQFLTEMLPELVWDLVPFCFLYDLYKEWMKRNNPASPIQGKKTFIKDVKHLMANNNNWRILSKNPHPTGSLMDKPEPLIAEYGLHDWKNPYYKGTDADRIYTTAPRSSYRGLLRL